jgi:transcriptional regulator with XRE-family HTH domain
MPNPIDIHVGMRLRLARTQAGFSQTAVADQVGITFQQIQKYEKGTNRIGASRLLQLARVLGIDVGFFFEGTDEIGDNYAGETQSFPAPIDLQLAKQLGKAKNARLKRAVLKLLTTFDPDTAT